MFLQPASIAAALDLMTQHGGRLLAGGTDFFPALGQQVPVQPVIDISRLAELRGITLDDSGYRIGAAARWSEIVAHPLPRCFDGLKAAAREVGSIQIQNRGTIGGNLCNASPAADSVPPLLTLDAKVELASPGGVRQIPLADFILGNRRTALRPSEIVTAVLVPRNVAHHASHFSKLGARRYLVISIAMVAVTLAVEDGKIADARIAIGSCSAVAQRMPRIEQALIGALADGDLAECVTASQFSELAPIDDVRATAAYRRDSALTLTRRAIVDCLHSATSARG
ncbi:MAG: xanthine dehydrogenase family protein subunit M [Rhodospirillaceae bacterium]|nr:xanthine dehydrogenase family protein subunit M [Rhodospirillaceae bacterium]